MYDRNMVTAIRNPKKTSGSGKRPEVMSTAAVIQITMMAIDVQV